MTPAGLGRRVMGQKWQNPDHLKLLNRALMRCVYGDLKRLMVFMPPRHAKSTMGSQFFPAWFLGTFPDRRVILTSYEAEFAASWGRKARNILQEYGPSLFNIAVSQKSSASHRWDIADRDGGMITAGAGGAVTGYGGGLIIVDDPIKNAEDANSPTIRRKIWEWWQSTLYTRLEPNGSIVLIQTRWHRDDLGGHLLREMKAGGEQWEVISLPALAIDGMPDPIGRRPGEALWTERFDRERLLVLKNSLDRYWWEALYQQAPVPQGGAEWPDEYFGEHIWFEKWPEHMTVKTVALDPSKGRDSKTSDYSAIVRLGRDEEGTLYCEADLERRDISRIVVDTLKHCDEFKPDALAIESNQFQQLLVTDIEEAGKGMAQQPPIIEIHNYSISKAIRIRRIGPYLSRKAIRFKQNSKGTALLVDQLRDFPNNDHDDGPDGLEMALRTAIEIFNGKYRTDEQVEQIPQVENLLSDF